MWRTVCFCAVILTASVAPARTWTDSTGFHTIEATLVGANDESVTLQKDDGARLILSPVMLSAADQQFVSHYIQTMRDLGKIAPKRPSATEDNELQAAQTAIQNLLDRIQAASQTDTSVRREVALKKLVAESRKEIEGKVFTFRFPIQDVAANKWHTFYLGCPEGINQINGYLDAFDPDLTVEEATKISTDHVLILRGHGEFRTGKTAQTMFGTVRPAICVIDVYSQVTGLYYGIALTNYKATFEKEVRVTGKPVPEPQAIASNQPSTSPASDNTSSGPPQFTAPPQDSTPTPQPQIVTAGDPQIPTAPSQPVAQPYTPPSATGVAPPQEPRETRNASYDPVQPIELKSQMARLVHSKTTPEMFSRRETRRRERFPSEYGLPMLRVGGHFHWVFWYHTEKWDVARRAMFLYQNNAVIKPELYRNALEQYPDLQAQIEKLSAKRVKIEPAYVDSEYADEPDLMFTDAYVDAVVNNQFNGFDDWAFPWGTMCGVLFFCAAGTCLWATFDGFDIEIQKGYLVIAVIVLGVLGWWAIT